MPPAEPGARTLVLLRHAKSDWSTDLPDVDRPIGARGRRQAGEAGRWLAQELTGLAPALDLALLSPARRAQETWQCASSALPDEVPVVEDHRAYTWSAGDLIAIVAGLAAHEQPVRTAVLVSHNPALDDLVAALTGEHREMKTSAIAVIRLPGGWGAATEPSGRLIAFGRPPSPVSD